MRRLRKKHASASIVVKAPENYAHLADETAGVVVNTELISETVTVESEVVSQIEYRNDSTNGEKQLKDDAIDAPADGVNDLTQITAAAGEEVNVENVPEAGDVIDNAGLYFASGADGDLAVNNVDGGEDEGEDGDHDVDGDEEDEDKENETGDDNNEQGNENLEKGAEVENGIMEEEEEMENEGEEAEVENENVDEEDEMENEDEEEDEEMENENEEEEEDVEDLKASNDEGGQVHIGKEEVKEDNTEKVGVEKVNVGKEEVKEDNRIKEGVEKVNVGKEEVKKDNTKKVGVKRQRIRTKKKGNPGGDANGVKKINGGASGEANIITGAKGGQSIPGAVIGEAEREKAKENIEGAFSNKKRKKPKKNKTKIIKEGPNQEATKQEDNKESTSKGKSKAKSMGMIFMCNTKTKNDCFRYKVFGLPSGKRDTVEKIYKGMRLFLYDVDLKLLYGIYKAAAPGRYNIEPKAFKSKFPSQVQFTVLGDCLPLPEEKFKNVLKENYYTKKKFNTILTSKQVKDLCTLFNSNKQHGDSKKSSKNVKRKPRDQVRSPRYPRYERGRDRERERAVIPSVRGPARLARLPPAAPPPYAYDRALEDPYRQPMLTCVADYRQPVLIRSDADYRRPVLARHDDYMQPVISRRDDDYRQPVINCRDDDYRPQPVISHRDDDYRPQPVISHRDDYRQQPVTTRRGDYRQHPVTTRRDDYRQQPLLLEDHVGDPYSRVDRLVVQRHDILSQNEYNGRVDPVIPYRGGSGYARDDIATVDPYTSTTYRHRMDTNGSVYAERDNGVAVLPEYRSVRPRYQYY